MTNVCCSDDLLGRRDRLSRATESAVDADLSLPAAPATPQAPIYALCLLEDGLDDPHQRGPQEGVPLQRHTILIHMPEHLCQYCYFGWTVLAQYLTVQECVVCPWLALQFVANPSAE